MPTEQEPVDRGRYEIRLTSGKEIGFRVSEDQDLTRLDFGIVISDAKTDSYIPWHMIEYVIRYAPERDRAGE